MSDSEYSSEDDEDYVPEPESESEVEDVQGLEGTTISSGKSKKTQAPKRKRKGGIKLADDDDDIDDDDDDEASESDEVGGLDDNVAKEKARKKQEEDEKSKKARMDDLWASFKSDTASVRKQPSTPSPSTKAVISKAESTNISKTNMLNTAQSSTDLGKVLDSKITITKTFDFAGESVKVTKKVDANSEEAKLAKKQEETKATNPPIVGNFSGTKRKGGLGSILGQIGKKPKISTLDKSKLDWESFKTETGISDDLRNYNKNGFLEKQDFLQRTDERQFEREKQTRDAIRKQ